MNIYGSKVIWGTPLEIKPITGLPEGKVRIRLRAGHVAIAFVKAPEGLRAFALKGDAETWSPSCELGRNIRVQRQ